MFKTSQVWLASFQLSSLNTSKTIDFRPIMVRLQENALSSAPLCSSITTLSQLAEHLESRFISIVAQRSN